MLMVRSVQGLKSLLLVLCSLSHYAALRWEIEMNSCSASGFGQKPKIKRQNVVHEPKLISSHLGFEALFKLGICKSGRTHRYKIYCDALYVKHSIEQFAEN